MNGMRGMTMMMTMMMREGPWSLKNQTSIRIGGQEEIAMKSAVVPTRSTTV
jgi:hypothetical protein